VHLRVEQKPSRTDAKPGEKMAPRRSGADPPRAGRRRGLPHDDRREEKRRLRADESEGGMPREQDRSRLQPDDECGEDREKRGGRGRRPTRLVAAEQRDAALAEDHVFASEERIVHAKATSASTAISAMTNTTSSA
jgi:hypothetical protein